MNTRRQFERYWPRGCIYADWHNYWAYHDLDPWHGWACPYDDRECPGRAVQVRRCQERLSQTRGKVTAAVRNGEGDKGIC